MDSPSIRAIAIRIFSLRSGGGGDGDGGAGVVVVDMRACLLNVSVENNPVYAERS